MRKLIFPFLAAILLTSVFLFAGNFNSTSGPEEVTKVENFSLKDYNGKTHNLKDYKDSKAIVLMFIATQCPVSNAYNKRMAEIYKNYKDKNVTFLAINSNKTEPVDEVKEHAKKNNFDFIILKDDNNKIADRLGATVTPEIYVLNSDYEVLYHGRIDDSRDEKNVKSNDLATALDEILAGKKVSNKKTVAFGCTIKRI